MKKLAKEARNGLNFEAYIVCPKKHSLYKHVFLTKRTLFSYINENSLYI